MIVIIIFIVMLIIFGNVMLIVKFCDVNLFIKIICIVIKIIVIV